MKLYSIPVSMLRQYCFCKRIPYLVMFKGVKPAETPWMKQGATYHAEQTELNKRRSFIRYGFTDNQCYLKQNVSLKSEDLLLHGICDGLLFYENKPVAVVEFKNKTSDKLNPGEFIQMTAYSMICEDTWGTEISYGFILSGERGKVKKVPITEANKQRVLQIRNEIIQCCEECLLPDSCASERQCGQCEYLNFCADRF